MKKLLTLIFCVSLFFFGCKQKEVTCVQSNYRSGAGIIFSNFNLTDLDTIIVTKYYANNSYNSIIEIDSEISYPILKNGVIYRSDTAVSFANLDDTYDISITIPAANKVYKVHALYGSDTITVYQAIGCRYRDFYISPTSIIVNGAVDSPVDRQYGSFIITK